MGMVSFGMPAKDRNSVRGKARQLWYDVVHCNEVLEARSGTAWRGRCGGQ